MKEQIEQALQQLVGLALTDSGLAGLQWFSFGENRIITTHKGDTNEVGEYALHVSTAWRIRSASKVILGWGDLDYSAGDLYHNFESGEDLLYTETRLAQRLTGFFANTKELPLTVQTIAADDIGGISLTLTEGYVLEVFPDDSVEREYWRLFRPGDLESHFVVTSDGIEEDN